MATVSSLRSRRFANHGTEVSQPFIAFRLRHLWFALPLQTVLRVTTLGTMESHGMSTDLDTPKANPLSPTLIDVDQQIFAGSLNTPNWAMSTPAQDPNQCLILLKTAQEKPLGLPIDSQPQLLRILPSRITPLPPNHSIAQKLKCVSAMTTQTDEAATLLFLNLDQI